MSGKNQQLHGLPYWKDENTQVVPRELPDTITGVISQRTGTPLWIMYHVTLNKNDMSITRQGINPEFAQGKRKASYWVTRDALHWAIAHVANRHNARVSDLRVYYAAMPEIDLLGTPWQGVYYTTRYVWVGGAWFSADLWLKAQEAQEQ